MADPNTKIMPWQGELVRGLMQGREIKLTMVGRQTGKSQLNRLIQDLTRFGNESYTLPIQELVLSEGTVYGSRYYCVEPVGGVWQDMEVWCLDTYGNPGTHLWGYSAPQPLERWYMNNSKFWFRTQKDRDWFIMRWNS